MDFKIIKPLKDLWYITLDFGEHSEPYYTVNAHAGMDLRVKNAGYPTGIGMPVYACANGEWKSAGTGFREGNYVTLSHDDGFTSLYFHLSSYTYRHGYTTVKQGDIIGYSGNTGDWCTGPHLHFELRKDNKPVDPKLYFTDEQPNTKDIIDKRNKILIKAEELLQLIKEL